MNVQDLIEILSDLDPNMPVRVAFQPNYPLSAQIVSVGIAEMNDSGSVAFINGFGNEEYAPRDYDEEIRL